jgi:protoporphyrinogen/coproporphyrinogen III oxidase
MQEALIDVQKSLALTEKPKTVEVTYWNNMMPKYHLGHGQAVQSLNQKMTLLFPNVILAGASYYGVGIGACIQNGKDTAELIANGLVLRQ